MPSPLAETWSALGAVFETIDPVAPAQFGDWEAEYRAATESAAVLDRSFMTRIELTGRDRIRFLHNLCTQDIKGLEIGRGREAFLTSVQGKVLYFVRILAGAESLWIDTVPGMADSLLAHLDHYRISEKVEIIDRSTGFVQLLLTGPRVRDCLEAAGVATALSPRDLDHGSVAIAGHDCILIYNAALDRPTVELNVPVAHAADAWQAVWQVGKPCGLRPMGTKAFEVLRIEAGWPVYGRDIDESNLPQEVGRTDRAVSFTKGCYLGQETVARIDALGHVNRHLVGLLIRSSSAPVQRGTRIVLADKMLGQVTSSAYSPAFHHTIALAYVRSGHECPGSVLTIDLPDGAVEATVCTLPFRP